MDADSVRHSAAGFAFQYRWAARRCLRMIDPKSDLTCITVEASKNRNRAGELVIDLAEYSTSPTGTKSVIYYQLKHSTVRQSAIFKFNDAKKTLIGFARRFSASARQRKKKPEEPSERFVLVTNRTVSAELKKSFDDIRQNKKTAPAFLRLVQKTTKLKGEQLRAFCSGFSFLDGQGDYIAQKERLHGEMREIIAGFVDSPEVDHLIELVHDRALPKSSERKATGQILPEDVLQKIKGTGRGLFPTPAEFEKLERLVPREGQNELVKLILASTEPVIIHAEGGVGKTVVARQIARSLPNASVAVLYDCFGGGKYRNVSSPRHRACDGLIQIANELAKQGLCRVLIGHAGTPNEALFAEFLQRLEQATKAVAQINSKAQLVIIVDAGDNAETAAAIQGNHSFVKPLLRERFPASCHLVVLCRTERINQLAPLSSVQRFALPSFSAAETAAHLRGAFPQANDKECEEFHRLTGGNPRVQSNILAEGHKDLPSALTAIGPSGLTVSDQINAQLERAVAKIRDETLIDPASVDLICVGLASLPPFIPIDVLAAAANVQASTIKSFVSDLGRPLWHSDDSVQFRDEPTETWFRDKFVATPDQISNFLKALEPLASKYTYVAKAIPQLLLQADNLEQLVELALSDKFLPADKPIDQRDVRVYRLRFAFRAAVKLGRLPDAVRLAFRAGEEVAGNQRQMELLNANVDLIAPLQDNQRVQELAYTQALSGAWLGSENIFSAALLSSVKDFRGEAASYLRVAHRWLRVYFEERKKQMRGPFPGQEALKRTDILEFIWTHYNLHGPLEAVNYLLGWTPPDVIFEVTSLLIQRLVEDGDFDHLDSLAEAGMKNPYFMIALAHELSNGVHLVPEEPLACALDLLLKTKLKTPRASLSRDTRSYTYAVVSFAEACSARKLNQAKILKLLRRYTSDIADREAGDDFLSGARKTFVRAIALKSVLSGKLDPDVKSMIPPHKEGAKVSYDQQRWDQNLMEMIGTLLPWYQLRARLICGDNSATAVNLTEIKRKSDQASHSRYYQRHDSLPYEVTRAYFEVLSAKKALDPQELEAFKKVLKGKEEDFTLLDRLHALSVACRLSHLASLRDELEMSCRETIELPGDRPEENAGYYIRMARAVLAVSKADAAVYFGKAVDAISKFGDEKVERWEAVVAVAARAGNSTLDREESAYRFLRCAEMIGEEVVREKYWDRNNVFSVAARLSPTGAIACLSRWRDRDVGSFSNQLEALGAELISMGLLPVSVGWSLSGFLGCRGSVDFVEVCLRKEASPRLRKRLFDEACTNFRLDGASQDRWKKLLELAKEFKLGAGVIEAALAEHESQAALNARTTPASGGQTATVSAPEAEPDLSGRNVLDPSDLDRLLERNPDDYRPREPELFWQAAVKKVPRGSERKFLEVLLQANHLSYIDVGYAMQAIKAAWGNRVSIEKAWPWFMAQVGKIFATEFANRHRLDFWLEMHSPDDASLAAFKSGLATGLAESADTMDAATFFGFIRQVANDLAPDDALDLLQFGLKRFEEHMPPKLGDGPWEKWLFPPATLTEAFAGLVWSALAAPQSVTRWEAAHCVRILAAHDCHTEIQELILWMKRGTVDSFGGIGLPFYVFHGRMYLLIALNRVAHENPKHLTRFSATFEEAALKGTPHILIQKVAAEAALALEKAVPGTYGLAKKSKLSKVGKSPFRVQDRRRQDEYRQSRRKPGRKKPPTFELSFGIDFEPYWFSRLGRVFGMAEADVTDLVRKVAITKLKIPPRGDSPRDARHKQWDGSYTSRKGTRHSHGSLPFIDDYRFYYAYHSLMIVGADLLRTEPVVLYSDWDHDPLGEWLENRLLIRTDGGWLADRRDPTPIRRQNWTQKQTDSNWRWETKANDFFDAICNPSAPANPLCVYGRWADHNNGNIETVRVYSALIKREHSQELAAEMRESAQPEQYPVPFYGSRDEEMRNPSFKMNGWLHHGESSDPRLDSFDPHARGILYPPCQVGASYAEKLRLHPDFEKRRWKQGNKPSPVLIDEIWSDEDIRREDTSYRWGERLTASIPFLKQLCKEYKSHLVIKVTIERTRHRDYRREEDEGTEYIPPSHKIFILTETGLLKDRLVEHKVA